MSRDAERGPLTVAAAILPGTRPAPTQRSWLEAVYDAIDHEHWRADKRAHMRAWAREIASHVHTPSMTTRATTAELMRAMGVTSPTTVKRARIWAEDHRLLAEVAPGRRGVYAPARTNRRTRADGTTTYVNDAAIRLLLLPEHAYEKAMTRRACGQKVTPSPERVDRNPRAHARKTSAPCSEPLRGTETIAQRLAALWPGQTLPAHRYRSWWARRATRSKDEEAVAVARLLAELAPVMRATTDRWIAHVIRPYLAAGWTVTDILHATDHRPDGTPWTCDTATVRRPEYWLRHRLAWWTDQHDQPIPSPSQRAQQAHAHDLATLQAAQAQRQPYRPRADVLPALIQAQRTLLACAPARQRTAIQQRLQELEAEAAQNAGGLAPVSGG